MRRDLFFAGPLLRCASSSLRLEAKLAADKLIKSSTAEQAPPVGSRASPGSPEGHALRGDRRRHGFAGCASAPPFAFCRICLFFLLTSNLSMIECARFEEPPRSASVRPMPRNSDLIVPACAARAPSGAAICAGGPVVHLYFQAGRAPIGAGRVERFRERGQPAARSVTCPSDPDSRT